MKRALIIVFLLAAPLHGRLTRHNFSFMLTGSLGLIGEYTNADPINRSPHHFPITNKYPTGGGAFAHIHGGFGSLWLGICLHVDSDPGGFYGF